MINLISEINTKLVKVVNNTIAKDLEDINAKVKDSSLALRKERVRMIKVWKAIKE